MNALEKIRLLEDRLNKLSVRDTKNQKIRRKIMREIRSFQKKENR